jgi:hypothetical protein
VLYLDRVEAQWPLRLTLDVGSHVPLHCTASGKLFLALMPKTARDALIDRLPLERMTANTITKADALRAECDEIAKRGYSRDREEFIAGLVAVAVPVRDAAGEVRAALAVHAPTARMSMEDAVKRIDALKAAAGKMSGMHPRPALSSEVPASRPRQHVLRRAARAIERLLPGTRVRQLRVADPLETGLPLLRPRAETGDDARGFAQAFFQQDEQGLAHHHPVPQRQGLAFHAHGIRLPGRGVTAGHAAPRYRT